MEISTECYAGILMARGEFVPPLREGKIDLPTADSVNAIVCIDGIKEVVWFERDGLPRLYLPKEEYDAIQPVLRKLPQKIEYRIIPGTVSPIPSAIACIGNLKGYEVICKIVD